MSLWADKFGEELWDLAEKMTKAQEIKMVICKNFLFKSDYNFYATNSGK